MVGRAEVDDLLVVVPGILGSRLRHRERGLVWGGAGTLRTLITPLGSLGLSSDGFRPDPDVEATGLVGFPLQLPGLSKIDAYTSLLGGLNQHFALDGSNLVVFAYDWRLSCSVNARLLSERVEPALLALRQRRPDARIVFVAHSMGGLIVQYFTDVLGGAADTKRVLTIGTPFRGSARALGAIGGSAPSGPSVFRSRSRDLVRTLPSVYELLPRYRAIIDGDARRPMFATDLPDGGNPDLFDASTKFHTAIERSAGQGYARTVIVGSLQRTAQFATMTNGAVELHEGWRAPDGTSVDERGDGTVPRQSVTPWGWTDDADAIPFSQTHIALPGTDDVLRVLRQILSARPRAEQGPQRAKLSLRVPDLVHAGEQLKITVGVPEGESDIPLVVSVEPVDGGRPPKRRTPIREDGELTARFEGLPAGDHRVRVAPAARLPDVRPLWDLVTIVDLNSLETRSAQRH